MNKVTEIAHKRIEDIRFEIRRMLDDKGNGDIFYKLEELYSRYLQVQALYNTASDMDSLLHNISFNVSDDDVLDLILKNFSEIKPKNDKILELAISNVVKEKGYINTIELSKNISSKDIGEYCNKSSNSVIISNKNIDKLDPDMILHIASGSVNLVLRDCTIGEFKALVLNTSRIKIAIIDSTIEKVSVHNSQFYLLITGCSVDLNDKSFEGNKLVGGFVNNNVTITGKGTATNITESLNSNFNHTVTSVRFMLST